MSKLKLSEIEIKPEFNSSDVESKKIKISALDQQEGPRIKEFDFNVLKAPGSKDYSVIKAKYGPLATTDSERTERAQKDRRFSLNPLLRDPLSVEQEEKRVIEEKVRDRITALNEKIKSEATQAGYQDGLKKGYEEAFKKFEAEGKERLGYFDHFLKEADNCKSTIFKANENFLIELVFRISRAILLKELSVDREYILRLAKELIAKTGTKENITLKINPLDAETIEMLKEGITKVYGTLEGLNIEASNQVERGSCQVETEWNAIDGSIQKQLDGIYQSLTGSN